MKTTKRTPRNGSAQSAPTQAATHVSNPTQPQAVPVTGSAAVDSARDDLRRAQQDGLVELMSCDPADESQTCLFANPEGDLFFWNGKLAEFPIAITLEDALAWVKAKRLGVSDFALPYYPERSEAHEFVSLVCRGHGRRAANAGPRAVLPSAPQNAPNLEEAVGQSVALTQLLQEFICSPESPGVGPALKGSFDAGLVALISTCNRNLMAAFYGQKGGAR